MTKDDEPDRIWTWQYTDHATDEKLNRGDWYPDADRLDGRGVPYLRATPARERAEELVEALRELSTEAQCRCMYISRDTERAYENGECAHQKARALLASLEQEDSK